MTPKQSIRAFLILALLVAVFNPLRSARAVPVQRPRADVTAYDLIIAMNTLRVSYGLPALIEDPIINAVAQSTAEIMAANEMSWHIGDVRGRIQAAGYGGGATVWATENFAAGSMTLDEIMVVWSDASHMIPAVNPAYCNVGAGVAQSPSGIMYYVLQAAYTSTNSCGEYRSPGTVNTPRPGGSTGGYGIIIPVKIATPDADGKIYHVVQTGQSFWSIAVAYKITIKDIETWNNISKDSKLQVGQKLFIPSSNTAGYATPTPVGMIQPSTPDADGKVIHTVQAYQTLITIATAYNVKVDTILSLNHLQVDWPLQIGQKLLISAGNVTPSPTPRPLTPVEKLTPASDGKYYHTVKSGETLSGIASLYGVPLNDLMAWNSLDGSSILRPDQPVLLQVTPPATATHTPDPSTATPTATIPSPTSSPTRSSTRTPGAASTPSPTPQPVEAASTTPLVPFAIAGLVAGGLILGAMMFRKKQN